MRYAFNALCAPLRAGDAVNGDAVAASTDAGGGQAGGAAAVRVDPRLKLLASGVTVETVMASRCRDGYTGGYTGGFEGAAAPEAEAKSGWAADNGGGGARGSPGQSRHDVTSVAFDGALWTRQRSPIAAVAARHVLNAHSRAGADVPQTSKPDIT